MMALDRSSEYHVNQEYSNYLTLHKIGQSHKLNKLWSVCVFNAIYHFDWHSTSEWDSYLHKILLFKASAGNFGTGSLLEHSCEIILKSTNDLGEEDI